jgi:hypothetical protein
MKPPKPRDNLRFRPLRQFLKELDEFLPLLPRKKSEMVINPHPLPPIAHRARFEERAQLAAGL